MNLKDMIRTIPDFPKEGILFRDITTLLKDKDGLKCLIDTFAEELKDKGIDLVVGPEARGFVLGSALAYVMGTGFVMARKPGKLPGETMRYEYALEYGTDVLEVSADAIRPGTRVVIVDDLLATGGTALATAKLVEQAGGQVAAIRFAMELEELGGRKTLAGYDVDAVIKY